jgi:Domain of unknown function (DUF3943)
MKPFAIAALALAFPAPALAQSDDAAKDLEPSWTVPTLHGLALLTTMRAGEAVIWPDPFADTNLSHVGEHYRRAYTEPPLWDSSKPAFEWDGDRWWINVFGHAAFGSELYLRVRTCKHGVLAALAFTAAGSTLWEYGFEANGVRPSGLDLWYTPAAGLVIGEARYLGWTAARSLKDRTLRGVLSAVFDPFGELERAAGTPC